MSEAEQIERLKRIIEEQKITISQISHEVRNPVTVINSSLQLIEKKCPAIREYPLWQDTMRDMKYLLRLLDEVSSYNNSTLLRKEVLDTSTWLSGFLSSLSRTVPAPFSLSWQVPPALPAICADPLKLRRALENLLRNGLRLWRIRGKCPSWQRQRRTPSASVSPIPAAEFPRSALTPCTSPLSPINRTVPAWACPSPSASSKPTGEPFL